MTDYQILGPEHFVQLRWKNGLGYTTELLKESLDDAEFAWRLSIAQVTQDGPFSDFAGYERILVLLRGQGITLEHGDGTTQELRRPLDAARFSGQGPTTASLHQGPIEDFNVMTRNGLCTAQVHTGSAQREFVHIALASLVLIYAGSGALSASLGGAEPLQVPLAHLLRADNSRGIELRVAGAGYIVVEIFA